MIKATEIWKNSPGLIVSGARFGPIASRNRKLAKPLYFVGVPLGRNLHRMASLRRLLVTLTQGPEE